VAAFAAPDAMERTVHVSFGDLSGEEYAFQVGSDLLVHGWDLARAIGADETMDPDLAAVVLERWQPQEPWLRGSGVVGPRVEVPPDASVQAKLIGFFGRRP
jgi:uncharacterized protein (TIGR03086 family)